MSGQDDDFPDITATLASIVEASSTLPPWYDAWARLRPESTEEDRLAVYQAIRDSGYLSDEEGFYLVSSQIEDMADIEATKQLRDLDDRIKAIEREYGLLEDGSWPNAEVPPEYEELSRRYQDAWDEIFVGKLEAFGEQEAADLYRDAPYDFAQYYDLGLKRFFQRSVTGDIAASPDELVRVVSFLDLPRADLAEMALAREGIPAALGNANFLSWFWHYSNAVGGVTVHVRRRDVKQAQEVLKTARAKTTESLTPWACLRCGQRIPGQWDTCWHCGAFADGTPGGFVAEQTIIQPEGDNRAGAWQILSLLLGAGAGVTLILPLRKHNPAYPAMLGPLVFIFVCIVVYLLWQFEPSATWPSVAEGTADLRDVPSRRFLRTRSSVSRAIVQRAWQAAVIGACAFPPLGFYSMRLLWKLGQRDTPLSCADTWRVWTAFFLSIVAIVYCILYAGLLVIAFLRTGV